MNVFIVSGNLGRDAELRYTTESRPVLSFPLPVKFGFGEKQKTSWLKCILWGERAERIHKYLLKGQKVIVQGEFYVENWVTREGEKRITNCLNVSDVEFAGSKQEQEQAPVQNTAQVPQPQVQQTAVHQQIPKPESTIEQEINPVDFDDDIPF